MASAAAQRKWRDKHRFVKTQLNVTTRRLVHGYLDDIATAFALRGKAEAVAFAAVVLKAIQQRTDFDPAAARIIEDAALAYRRDRDLYA